LKKISLSADRRSDEESARAGCDRRHRTMIDVW
jgi:hypothetical protein